MNSERPHKAGHILHVSFSPSLSGTWLPSPSSARLGQFFSEVEAIGGHPAGLESVKLWRVQAQCRFEPPAAGKASVRSVGPGPWTAQLVRFHGRTFFWSCRNMGQVLLTCMGVWIAPCSAVRVLCTLRAARFEPHYLSTLRTGADMRRHVLGEEFVGVSLRMTGCIFSVLRRRSNCNYLTACGDAATICFNITNFICVKVKT